MRGGLTALICASAILFCPDRTPAETGGVEKKLTSYIAYHAEHAGYGIRATDVHFGDEDTRVDFTAKVKGTMSSPTLYRLLKDETDISKINLTDEAEGKEYKCLGLRFDAEPIEAPLEEGGFSTKEVFGFYCVFEPLPPGQKSLPEDLRVKFQGFPDISISLKAPELFGKMGDLPGGLFGLEIPLPVVIASLISVLFGVIVLSGAIVSRARSRTGPEGARGMFSRRQTLKWLVRIGSVPFLLAAAYVVWEGVSGFSGTFLLLFSVAVFSAVSFIHPGVFIKQAKFFCPHCDRYVKERSPWLCPYCGKRNRGGTIFDSCAKCREESGLIRCNQCGEVIELPEGNAGEVTELDDVIPKKAGRLVKRHTVGEEGIKKKLSKLKEKLPDDPALAIHRIGNMVGGGMDFIEGIKGRDSKRVRRGTAGVSKVVNLRPVVDNKDPDLEEYEEQEKYRLQQEKIRQKAEREREKVDREYRKKRHMDRVNDDLEREQGVKDLREEKIRKLTEKYGKDISEMSPRERREFMREVEDIEDRFDQILDKE